jgi:hypothetical protein
VDGPAQTSIADENIACSCAGAPTVDTTGHSWFPCSCSPSAQVLAPHSVNGTSPSQRRVRRVAMLLATLVVRDDV